MIRRGIRPSARDSIRQRWRFAIVLLASLLFAVAQPLTSGLFDERSSFDVFFSLLIAAVLLLVFEEREHRRVALSLGLAGFHSETRGMLPRAGAMDAIGAQSVYPTLKSALNAFLNSQPCAPARVPEAEDGRADAPGQRGAG